MSDPVEIDGDRAAAMVASALGAVSLDGEPRPLDGGRSAQTFAIRVSAGPDAVVGRELVLRVIGDRGSLAEAVIQQVVADAGYPTPRVLAFGTHDAANFSLMEYAEGKLMAFAGGPVRALRSVPARLASLLVDLRSLDPDPVATALIDHGWASACDLEARVLGEIEANLDDTRSGATHDALRWLLERRPEPGRRVVCHGDLHGLNVLTSDSDLVIDWELAGLAHPTFDVARTHLLLSAVPMPLPQLVAGPIRRLGRRSANRFLRSYDLQSSGVEHFEWYSVLHACRISSMVRAAEVRGPLSEVEEGWASALPVVEQLMRTGIRA